MVYSSFKDNIWSADSGDVQLITKFEKEIKTFVIDIFGKYTWVFPLKDKKGVTIVNAFQNLIDNSVELHPKSRKGKSKGHKRSKIWVDKRSEFYNNSFKKWLKDNDIGIYSTHNKGKSAFAERFIRILKHMTSISKNLYIDKLDEIVNEYNI